MYALCFVTKVSRYYCEQFVAPVYPALPRSANKCQRTFYINGLVQLLGGIHEFYSLLHLDNHILRHIEHSIEGYVY